MGIVIGSERERAGDAELRDVDPQQFGSMFGDDLDIPGGGVLIGFFHYTSEGVAVGKASNQRCQGNPGLVYPVDRSFYLLLRRINLDVSR